MLIFFLMRNLLPPSFLLSDLLSSLPMPESLCLFWSPIDVSFSFLPSSDIPIYIGLVYRVYILPELNQSGCCLAYAAVKAIFYGILTFMGLFRGLPKEIFKKYSEKFARFKNCAYLCFGFGGSVRELRLAKAHSKPRRRFTSRQIPVRRLALTETIMQRGIPLPKQSFGNRLLHYLNTNRTRF